MAFKRYINKHGKKLGPYYYENIRGPDGSVKTIYLGTNPHEHSKHKIRKPLFFLILVLALILLLGSLLFFWQNKSYLIKQVKSQEADFDVDQILLKVLIKNNEFTEKQIRIMNTGNKPAAINVEAFGLEDIVKIDAPSFSIKPGQTKVVVLNFSSFLAEQKIEQQPGIYVGKLIVKSEKASREIPIVVEIETKNVLFDMNLNPVAIERRVNQGSDTTIEVRLFNLQSIESSSVDVDYFVKDVNGNTIVTESETVVVKTQASFFKTISIPKNLKPGPYVFASRARFGDSIGTSSYMFEVTGPETEASFVQFCKNSVVCLGLSLTTILLLFALMAYFYFFIGAYLYGKVTGIVTLPRKRKEEVEESGEVAEEKIIEKPKVSFFDKIKIKIDEWKEQREMANKEKERLKEQLKIKRELEAKQKEQERLAEKRKAELEARRIEIEEEREKIEEERLEKLKKYEEKKVIKPSKKRQEELMKEERLRQQKELRRQRAEERRRKRKEEQQEAQREEELKLQKEIEERRREEERRAAQEYKARKKLEREKSWEERKEKTKDFFHKLGLYKTPEEKTQIALQKERERREEIRKEEEARKQKEIETKLKEQQRLAEERRREFEKTKQEEERKRNEEEERRQREIEQKLKELQVKKLEEEQRRQKEFEAKKLEEEQQKQREQDEKLRKLEEENTRMEELKRAKEERENARKEEKLRLQEERISKEEEKKRKLKPKERLELIGIKKQVGLEKPKPEEKKPSIFERLFKKEKPEIKIEEVKEESKEEKLAEQKQLPASEAEELEEAIKSLDLFKEIENKVTGRKEPEKKPGLFERMLKKKKQEIKKISTKEKIKEEKLQAKIVGKSKKLDKFYKILNEAKESIKTNNIAKAKKLYIEARDLYVGLEYEEKKEAYKELMELYNKLLR